MSICIARSLSDMVIFTVVRLIGEHGARMRISVFVYQVADLARLIGL